MAAIQHDKGNGFPDRRSFTTKNGKFCLYFRSGSTKFQAYLKPINGEWMRLSTSKDDFEDAREFAIEKLIELKVNIANGNPIRTRKFRDVAELTLGEIRKELEDGTATTMCQHYIGTINRLLIPFFGNFNIENISDKAMDDFARWRNEQYGRKLKTNTVKNQYAALNRVFKTALERNWMKTTQIPRFNTEGVKSERRAYFTLEELELIESCLDRKWIAAGGSQRIREARELVKDLFYFLLCTGCRAGTEISGIRKKHLGEIVGNGNVYTTIKIVEGKKKEVRTVVADPEIEIVLESFNKRFPEATEDDLIIRTASGKPFSQVKGLCQREFRKALEALGLRQDTEGNTRSLYSLRHCYATTKLVHRKLDYFKLAKQMGTSVHQLEKTYSHLEAIQVADEIAG